MRGLPPLGRWIGLVMVCAGLGTVSLATPGAAVAAAPVAARASGDSPTAVAVAADGSVYVGFASGGKIQRLAPGNGKAKGSIELDSDSPVAGLFATSGGSVWVDQESGISLLGRNGGQISSFDHQPDRDCDTGAPASRYGGITAHGSTVYVANRCHGSVSVYSRSGHLQATVDLPGGGYPRGITYGDAQAGKPATLYVAMPDRGVVVAYRARSLRSSSKPMHTYKVRRPPGGKQPQPAGIAVDKWGQLTITDMANNAVYLVDANNGYSLYRTLGHPPRASRQAGRLNNPSALAQHDQDGGGMSGDLFIADAGNTRVQRWNTSGYTYWAKKVNAAASGNPHDPGGPGPDDPDDPDGPDNPGGAGPTNTELPSISGTYEVGQVVTCNRGGWVATGGPAGGTVSFSYRWRRDSTTIPAATAATYTITSADDGTDLSCVVRATNSFGYNEATSPGVPVAGGGGGARPTNTEAPTITGTPAVGQVLTCNKGTWTPAGLTYTYVWKRDSVTLSSATSSTYKVTAADKGKALTCLVTGKNATGETEATSAAFTITGGGTGTGTGPVNSAPPTITGTLLPGELLTCDPGSWTGADITYTFVWRAGTTDVGVGRTYTVLSDDVGKTFTCAVTATFAAGSTVLSSAPVTVSGPAGRAPLNTTPPSISPSGTVAVGTALTCSPGVWSGAPTYTYLWLRDDARIGGATEATYTPTSLDAGTTLACTVVASNGSGQGAASSSPVTVADAHPPTNAGGAAAPSISGSGTVGTAVTCLPGAWTGTGISYKLAWSRNGVPIPDTGSAKYVVLSEDVGTSLSCTVTARNTAGTSLATSPARSLDAVVPGAPTPTTAPEITGTSALGQTLTCSTGGWTGAPLDHVTLWQRDGVTLDPAGPTHVVVAADQAATLRCVVVAVNAAGAGAARSAPVGGSACTGSVGVTINDGDAQTDSALVQLSIRVPAGTTSIAISNSSDMSRSQTVTPTGTCSYAWTMSSIAGLPMTWSVYVQLDGAGTIYTDSILIDRS